jgi:hypothetical protein
MLLTQEFVLFAVEKCLPAVAWQWTTFLGLFLRLTAIMSRYIWKSETSKTGNRRHVLFTGTEMPAKYWQAYLSTRLHGITIKKP